MKKKISTTQQSISTRLHRLRCGGVCGMTLRCMIAVFVACRDMDAIGRGNHFVGTTNLGKNFANTSGNNEVCMYDDKYNEFIDFRTTTNSRVWNLMKFPHKYNMHYWDFEDKQCPWYNRNRNPCDWKSHRKHQWR